MAVPRTAPAAQAEPGERGDAGQGPPGRGHRDSNPAPALVAVWKGIKLRGNIIHVSETERGRAISATHFALDTGGRSILLHGKSWTGEGLSRRLQPPRPWCAFNKVHPLEFQSQSMLIETRQSICCLPCVCNLEQHVFWVLVKDRREHTIASYVHCPPVHCGTTVKVKRSHPTACT